MTIPFFKLMNLKKKKTHNTVKCLHFDEEIYPKLQRSLHIPKKNPFGYFRFIVVSKQKLTKYYQLFFYLPKMNIVIPFQLILQAFLFFNFEWKKNRI